MSEFTHVRPYKKLLLRFSVGYIYYIICLDFEKNVKGKEHYKIKQRPLEKRKRIVAERNYRTLAKIAAVLLNADI